MKEILGLKGTPKEIVSISTENILQDPSLFDELMEIT